MAQSPQARTMSSARMLRGSRVLEVVMSGLTLLLASRPWPDVSNVSSSIAMQEKQVRKQLQKKIVLETRKDGTKFTSEKLKAAAQRLYELTKQYTDVQRTLVDSVRF
jgi:hypothetical protein